jgi:hypothetical protein
MIGYIASMLVLFTFVAKDMRLLRTLATFSNLAFITYGAIAWLPPVLRSASCPAAPEHSSTCRDRLLADRASSWRAGRHTTLATTPILKLNNVSKHDVTALDTSPPCHTRLICAAPINPDLK